MNDDVKPYFKIAAILITIAATFVTYITINTNIYIGGNVTEPIDIIDTKPDDISYDFSFSVYSYFKDGNNYYIIDFNKTLIQVDKATYDRLTKHRQP